MLIPAVGRHDRFEIGKANLCPVAIYQPRYPVSAASGAILARHRKVDDAISAEASKRHRAYIAVFSFLVWHRFAHVPPFVETMAAG